MMDGGGFQDWKIFRVAHIFIRRMMAINMIANRKWAVRVIFWNVLRLNKSFIKIIDHEIFKVYLADGDNGYRRSL